MSNNGCCALPARCAAPALETLAPCPCSRCNACTAAAADVAHTATLSGRNGAIYRASHGAAHRGGINTRRRFGRVAAAVGAGGGVALKGHCDGAVRASRAAFRIAIGVGYFKTHARERGGGGGDGAKRVAHAGSGLPGAGMGGKGAGYREVLAEQCGGMGYKIGPGGGARGE